MENENKNIEVNNLNQTVSPENTVSVPSQEQVVAPAQNVVEAPSIQPAENPNAQPTGTVQPAAQTSPVTPVIPEVTLNQTTSPQPTVPQDITQISSGLQSKEEIEINKSNTGIKVIIGVLIFLLLVLTGLGGAYIYVHTDEYIIGSSIKSFNNIKENYFPKLNYDMNFNGNLTAEGTMNFKIDSSEKNGALISNALKDLKVDYKYIFENKNMLMDSTLSKENEELVGLKFVYKEYKTYLLLKKIFDKYIDLEIEEEMEIPTNEELNSLIEVAYESFTNNFFKKKLIKNTEDIIIDGETLNVASNKIEYTEEELYILLNQVLEDIKADSKAKAAAKKLYKDFEKFNFDDYLNELDKEHMGIYTYIIYTDKLTSKALGIDFVTEYYEEIYKDYEDCDHLDDFDEYFDCIYEPVLEKTNTKISYRTGKKEIIELFEKDEKQGAYIISKDGNKTIIAVKEYVKSEEKELAKIEIYSKDDTINILFETKEDEEVLKVNYDLVLTEVKTNSEYKLTANVIMNYEDKELKENTRFELNLNGTIKDSGEIKEDVSNAIKMSELTDEDIEIIQNNLTDVFEKLGILDEEELEEPEEILPQNEVVAE